MILKVIIAALEHIQAEVQIKSFTNGILIKVEGLQLMKLITSTTSM